LAPPSGKPLTYSGKTLPLGPYLSERFEDLQNLKENAENLG